MEEQINEYLRTLEPNSKREDAIAGLAWEYEQSGDDEAAAELLAYGLSTGETLYYELATAYDRLENSALATSTRLDGVRHFERLISEGRASEDDYAFLHLILGDLGDKPKLREFSAAAHNRFPTDTTYIHTLAESYNESRQYQKTIDLIQESTPTTEPMQLLNLRLLEQAHEALGNHDDAARVLHLQTISE